MIKLMRLELMKFSLGWYFISAIIANLCIIAMMIVINYVEASGEMAIKDLEEACVVIGSSVRATFVILAGVMVAKLIIEEYKNKTIFVLFTYPISRKKVLTAKLLFIAALTGAAVFISNLFTAGVFLLLNSSLHIIPGIVDMAFLQQQVLSILTFSIATAGTSLIPLYFGLRKQSIPATIVSSILIVALISSHNPAFSIASIIYVPLALSVVGVAIASWAIRNVETTDVC
ncbi:ABC transporter permease [Paenibacillus lentus]|uniref:ABC transporter permease n=1 Tax=Paenibacillus lentus TaxID=1338368 RepID=A0A3Q8S4N8_9BACL|nr:ABC transporter permease [Paenibacillus lentus]AZK46444.1 ABC transporter permease [Paenibacillus lentus]